MGWEQTSHTPRGSLGLRGPMCPLLFAPSGCTLWLGLCHVPHIHPGVHPPQASSRLPMPPPPPPRVTPARGGCGSPQSSHQWLQTTRRSNKTETSFEPDSSVTATSTHRPGSPRHVPRRHLSPRHTHLPQDTQQQYHAEPRRGPAPWLPGPLLRPHADQGRGGLLPEPLLHLGGGEDPAPSAHALRESRGHLFTALCPALK